MSCKICGSSTSEVFKEKILNKYVAAFLKCNNCGFLFTENPYWLAEAYEDAITYSDTGIIQRNIQFSKISSVLIDFYFNRKAKFLDYAGGYGLFTRMMRDIGFDFYWTDKYCQNLFSRGFEHNASKADRYELITAFEVFEHLGDPVEELKKMLTFSNNIIFSTELLQEAVPDPKKWWYYNFVHGQHISFYSYDSLALLGKMFNLNFYSIKGIHVYTEKKLNESTLRLLKKVSLVFLFDLLKIRYKSKTFEDHLFIKNNYK